MTRTRRILLALAALVLPALAGPGCRSGRGDAGAAAGPGAGAPAACRPDWEQPVAAESERTRLCVIDVGSRNVKLVVASARGADGLSLKNERQCRARLHLGDKTFDPVARTPRPLAPDDQKALFKLMGQYDELCKRDGGKMLGAIATEWARRATNPDDITTGALAHASITMEVVSREREARYGYLAASRGAQGKIVLDFGSRSLQLSFWPRGAQVPEIAGMPLGIDEAGDQFFDRYEHKTYGSAKEAFLGAVRGGLGPVIDRIRADIERRVLDRELYSLGENGDLVLALQGKLWDPQTHKGIDEAAYAGMIKGFQSSTAPGYGMVTGLFPLRDFAALALALETDNALYEELRSNRIKRIYGFKMLAFPAVASLLASDLGIEKAVLVPQEMADGFIVEKMQGGAN